MAGNDGGRGEEERAKEELLSYFDLNESLLPNSA